LIALGSLKAVIPCKPVPLITLVLDIAPGRVTTKKWNH